MRQAKSHVLRHDEAFDCIEALGFEARTGDDIEIIGAGLSSSKQIKAGQPRDALSQPKRRKGDQSAAGMRGQHPQL